MPVLKNPRHELFAQEMAKGKSATDAYLASGYETDVDMARRAGSRLAANPTVRERIDELLGSIARRAEIKQADVIKELAKLGFANMLDYITIGADGLPFTDFSAVSREQAAAIYEVTVETRTEIGMDENGKKEAVPVRKVKFRLADKRAALVDIGRHLGMFIDRREVGKPGEFDRYTDDELEEILTGLKVVKTKKPRIAGFPKPPQPEQIN